jgi:hypothetical protein
MPTIFKAFFSYAHHDADTDPGLVPAFTTALENRVNAKLVNARFAIWRDKEGLRTGDRWDAKIESELRGSDVLIVLLGPRWIDSPYCRKEYEIFEEVESGRAVGDYVAPILARSITTQERHLNAEQRKVYDRIKTRQYQKAYVTNFLQLSEDERTALIDKIADDIEGMIERLRSPPTATSKPALRTRTAREFDVRAQNYERVDFVTDGEVVLGTPGADGERDVLVHVGFFERLYVQGQRGRVEFGVRRAFVSIDNHGPGSLSRIDKLKGVVDQRNFYYVPLHEAPRAITVCMDPPAGKTSLAELPLPPAENENSLSKVATASANIRAKQLKADLIVWFNVEGLSLADDSPDISPRAASAIKAIMDVARAKAGKAKNQAVDQDGQFRRTLPVRERS